MRQRNFVIVGATSGIAHQCARLWVRVAVKMTLVGRDQARLERVAADLRVRSPDSDIQIIVTDFLDPNSIQAMVDNFIDPVDMVLIAHGWLPDQKQCQKELNICKQAIDINALSPALFAEAFAGLLERQGYGTLALIGSVAGDRGRQSNYVYGAAKSLLECYAQGLRNRLTSSGVTMVLIKPGPTDTAMTNMLKIQGARLASVNLVAAQIVSGIDKRCSVIYTPRFWRYIILVLRCIPNFIFNRLKI